MLNADDIVFVCENNVHIARCVQLLVQMANESELFD